MKFNRRAFLQLMSAFVADPERLLWVPGQKKIFIPPEHPVIDLARLLVIYNGEIIELLYDNDPFARVIKASRLKQRDTNDTLLTSANAIGWNGF